MTRKHSLLGAAAVVGLALSFGAGEVAASEKVEWNVSVWGNPRAWTKGIETAAEYVKEHSGGNFTMIIHYGETLSPSRQNLDGLSIGAFEAASICTSYHPGKNPIGTVLDLPFLPYPDMDAQIKSQDKFMEESQPWIDEMGRWGAKPYFSGVLPQYEFMGRGNPPKSLDDWRGMRVRALGGLGEAMRRLGAVPTTVPAPETYTAVERGVVQAASWPFSYAHAAYRLHEISTWFTGNMAPGAVFCPMLVSQRFYDELPAEYQGILMDAKPAAYQALVDAYAEADAKNLPMFRERMTEITYSEEELAAFREAGAQPVWDDWVEEMEGRGLPGREVLQFVLDSIEEAQAKGGS